MALSWFGGNCLVTRIIAIIGKGHKNTRLDNKNVIVFLRRKYGTGCTRDFIILIIIGVF